MAFSGIENSSPSMAQLVHDQFRTGVLSAFATLSEMSLFDPYKTDLSDAPATKEKFAYLKGRSWNSTLPADPSSDTLPTAGSLTFGTGEYRTKEYRSALKFSIQEMEYLDACLKTGKDLTSGAFLDATERVSIAVDEEANILTHKLLCDLFGDGTGVVAQVSGNPTIVSSTGVITIPISSAYNARGSINFLDYDAVLVSAAANGTLDTFTNAATTDALKVIGINYENSTVVCQLINAAGANVNGGVNTITTTMAAGSLLYFGTKAKVDAGEIQVPDLSAAITEYDTITNHILGLRALVRNDGAVVQGIERSGLMASIIHSAGGAALRPTHLSELIIKMSRRWRKSSRFTYDTFLLAEEVLNYLINSAQADRRLIGSHTDGVPAAFGSTKFTFMDPISGRQNSWNFAFSTFIPLQDIYLLPKVAGDMKPLSLPYQDMHSIFKGSEAVGGLGGMLPSPSSSTYTMNLLHFEKMRVGFFSKMPAALAKVTNFALT